MKRSTAELPDIPEEPVHHSPAEIFADFGDPRVLLEQQEGPPDAEHEALALILSRLLAWMVAPKTPRQVGVRVFAMCQAIRPDLIVAMLPEHRAECCRGTLPGRRRRLRKQVEAITGSKAQHYGRQVGAGHLQVINQFCRWHRRRAAELTAADRARILRDFGQVRQFLQEIAPP